MLLYGPLYRNNGVRRTDQWRSPMVSSLTGFSSPYKTIVHHLPEGVGDDWANPNDLFLKDAPSQIKIENIVHMAETQGRPYPVAISISQMVSFYRRKYPAIKLVKATKDALGNTQHIFVQNYGLLDRKWRYRKNDWARWHHFSNLQKTLWKNVNRVAGITDWHQFIPVYLPITVPTKELFAKTVSRLDRTTLKYFPDDAGLFMLELWKWLGVERDTSLIKLDPQHYDKVTLMFIESGQYILVNLGVLDSFRKVGAEELSEEEEENHKGAKSPLLMQKEFIIFLNKLLSVRTAAPKIVTTVKVSDEELAAEKIEDGDEVVEVVAPVSDEPSEKVDPSVKVTPSIDENVKPLKVVSKIKIPTEKEMGITPNPKIAAKAMRDPSELANKLGFVLTEIKSVGAGVIDLAKTERLLTHEKKREIPAPVPAEEPENDNPEPNENPEPDLSPLQPSELVLTVPVGVAESAEKAVQDGLLTVGECKRMIRLSESYKSIKNPMGEGSLETLMTIPDGLLSSISDDDIPDIPTVLDKSMLHSTLIDFDRKYINKVLPRHIAQAVMGIQNADVAVVDYQVERVVDAMNKYDSYVVKVAPVHGKTSSIRFRLPVVDENGTFTVNGTKRRLRKQRGDVPIRKTGPGRVALSSYYGKVFVNRAEKTVSDYGKWLVTKIQERVYNDELPRITDLHYTYIPDHDNRVPRIYSALAERFSGFTIGTMRFWFYYPSRVEQFGLDVVDAAEKSGRVICGMDGKAPITIAEDGLFYKGDEILGTIESIVNLDATKAPVDYAELKVMGKNIPLGIVLGHYMGLGQLMRLLKIRPIRIKRGGRYGLDGSNWALKFNDEVLVFSKEDRLATMILAGFQGYHREIGKLSVYDFEQSDAYTYVMAAYGLGPRYANELDLMLKMFIDPITEECLVRMGEPTKFIDLLLRAAELLLRDDHPAATKMSFQRLKGYERFAGTVYGELVKSMRQYQGRPVTSNTAIDLNPNAVWMTIQQDPSVLLVEESNPVHNLREKENVTFGGNGGRTSRSMVRSSRVFDPDDMGVISEATVDNADVAINTYTSADPNIVDLLGMTRRYDPKKDGPAKLLSTSALLAPASVNDDPKRVNFINIQHGSGIAAEGYQPTPLRTGYEQVLAHRVDDLFAYTAKQDGKVTALDDQVVTLTYQDGSTVSIELGRRYGTVAGSTIPHEIKAAVKLGQVFKKGRGITYNAGFFEIDPLNTDQFLWKAGVLVNTALMDITDTIEDSSTISARVGELMASSVTEPRTLIVRFDQSIRNLVKPGTSVDADSILCMIEDSITADNNLFDEDSLKTLRYISAQTPPAKIDGVVERVEIFYNGDVVDMSDSLAALVKASDREMAKRAKALNGEVASNGRVDDALRIAGKSLEFEQAAIRVYITTRVTAGVGDKGVFGNQLKTIFGRVMSGENRTESGLEIDAIFGYQSISDRIVNSPDIMGTTNSLLRVISKRGAEIFRGKKP